MRSARPIALVLLCLAAASPGVGASPSSAPSSSAAAKTSQAEGLYHVFAPGETIYSVSRKYSVPVETLISANGIKDPSKIPAGQKLLIPSIHTVKKGETLFGIAKAYSVTVDELRSANALKSSDSIRAGQKLFVPRRADAKAASPAAAQAPATAAPQAAKSVAPKTVSPEPIEPLPALPEVVKTQARTVDRKVSWPCEGEAAYLDGKAQGIIIQAKLDAPQKAVASGKIVAAGPFRGYGEMAIVMSRTGYLYVYAGNQSLSVRIGDSIVSGQEIGRVGLDARQGTPAAFFMVYRGREVIDPALAPRD